MVSLNELTAVMQVASSAVLAIFTVVLAISTWRYYQQAKFQTKEISSQTTEMRKARELQYEPELKAGVRCHFNPNFCLSFVNIGGGLAQDVSAKYYLENLEGEPRRWGRQVVFPEEVCNLGFPIPSGPEHGVIGPEEQFAERLEESGGEDILIVEFESEDSAGNTYEDVQRFSILDEIHDYTESTEFYLGVKTRTMMFRHFN